MNALSELRSWPVRRWVSAGVAALLALLILGVPTDVISNPWFGRSVPPTWWSAPVLGACALLCGLLAATYVRATPTRTAARTWPGVGPVLAFFAIGCPVCNKLVLVALGTTGALNWFEPLQPLLAVASVGALAWALNRRLETAGACSIAPALSVASRDS